MDLRTNGWLSLIGFVGFTVGLGCSSKMTVAVDGAIVTDATDASVLACRQSVAEFCAPSDPDAGLSVAPCDLQLATALGDQQLCHLLGGQQACGPYQVVVTGGIDSGDRYYYDQATGALVAVVGYVIPRGDLCLAGPPSFVVPPASQCGTSTRLAICSGGP